MHNLKYVTHKLKNIVNQNNKNLHTILEQTKL